MAFSSVRNPLFHNIITLPSTHMVVRWKTGEGRGGASSPAWNPMFHQSTQYHMVVRWKTGEGRGGASSPAWNPMFHQSTQHHMVVRWKTGQ